jgi:ABC-type sugar transport system ATPase subunit
MSQPAVLELVGIEKSFPGVRALRGVDLDVRPGEVHCLVGENGAGKSTLIKILAGVHQADSGEVRVLGEPRRFAKPHEAQAAGLSFVFQELNVVEHLTVADNMSLGLEPTRARWDRADAEETAAGHLRDLGVDIEPGEPMHRLRPAERQLVMIARALSTSAKAIVLDEPTAALTETEIARLFEIVRRLRDQRVAVLYVSHRLDEVFALADRITVLRDGQRVATHLASEVDRAKVIALMVGRVLDRIYEHPVRTPGAEALRLEGVAGAHGRVTGINLVVHAGEVVGLSGIVGSGRTELARLIFGAEPLEAGTMSLWGAPYHPAGPREAIASGVGLVPEERRTQGIVGVLSVRENVSMAAPGKISSFGLVNRRADGRLAERFRSRLNIRTPGVEQQIRLLSGGNQQKAVIAKWLASEARLLVLDEPTRGVDVGAKAEIFHLINELAAAGNAILMISSELEEIVEFCDRVAVMRDGTVVRTLEPGEIDRERVMHLATGGD